jgi:hypothetical protein
VPLPFPQTFLKTTFTSLLSVLTLGIVYALRLEFRGSSLWGVVAVHEVGNEVTAGCDTRRDGGGEGRGHAEDDGDRVGYRRG